MLGKAMLTMNRSSEDKKTPVSTIRAVRTGRGRVAGAGGLSMSSFIKRTLREKVA
jgi:hypothetical protein